MRWVIVTLAAAAALGCASEAKDRASPANAFARLAPCVDRADARCVYHELDRASRWSVQSIHRILAEMRALVERSYPQDRRSGPAVYGAWAGAVLAADDPGTFAAYCARRGCMEEIAAGFGPAASSRDLGAGRAEVVTTRGLAFVMASADGAWGLATYAEELAAEKIRLADKLVQVRIDAKAYDEQRRATGAAAP
jgi:hypothetical protein